MSNPNHTTAFKVFHYNYQVMLPAMYMWDENADNLYGRPTTGDPSYDRDLALSKQHAFLNIATMATKHSEGVPLTLIVPMDAVEIYEIIRDHIQAWVDRVNNDLNCVDFPKEDLYILECFARDVWEMAKIQKPPELQDIGIMRAINGVAHERESALFLNHAENQRAMAEAAKPFKEEEDQYLQRPFKRKVDSAKPVAAAFAKSVSETHRAIKTAPVHIDPIPVPVAEPNPVDVYGIPKTKTLDHLVDPDVQDEITW